MSGTNVFSKLMSLSSLGKCKKLVWLDAKLNCMKKYFAAVNAIVLFLRFA